MYMFLVLVGALIAVAVLYVGQRVLNNSTFLHRPVYVPSTPNMQKTMMELANCRKSDAIIDLGSGDGSLLLCAANAYPDCTIHGVEINPLLVWKSKKLIASAGLQNRITIMQGSLWNIHLGQYDVVLLYGTAAIMEKLEQKVLAEMRPGSRVVSSVFTFPKLQPARTIRSTFLYTFPILLD